MPSIFQIYLSMPFCMEAYIAVDPFGRRLNEKSILLESQYYPLDLTVTSLDHNVGVTKRSKSCPTRQKAFDLYVSRYVLTGKAEYERREIRKESALQLDKQRVRKKHHLKLPL